VTGAKITKLRNENKSRAKTFGIPDISVLKSHKRKGDEHLNVQFGS